MKKLNEEEIKTIQAFITNYSNMFSKITELENELESLTIKKGLIQKMVESLNEEITDVRKKEKEYNDYLIKKYGSFKLNIETFEIGSA